MTSITIALAMVAELCGCGSTDGASCEPGQELVRACGECGEQVAACADGEFGDYGACEEPPTCSSSPDAGPQPDAGPPPCSDGDVDTRSCGDCGTQSRTCTGTTWSDWSDCTGEGECTPDAADTAPCGTDVGECITGTKTRTCSSACAWSAWDECGGTYVGPSPESCGDALDNDCNGVADEGCECAPVGIGAPGSIAVTGTLSKLVADPADCFVYGLDVDADEVVVFDTATKSELTRIPLPYAGNDIDISPSGAYLIVAHDAAHAVSAIEKASWTVTSSEPTVSDPYALEVDDTGRVYYAESSSWVDIRRIDLGAGIGSDSLLSPEAWYRVDLELSSDGASLYVGESGLSACDLIKYDVSGGGWLQVGRSIWDDGYGFPTPARHVYLSPRAGHVYYAGYQLDGANLELVRGQTAEKVFVEDAAETFAIGESQVWDAELMVPVAPLDHAADAAALSVGDAELWYYDAAAATVYYQNADDYVFGVGLGERERTPGPLSSYHFSKLVRDPIRNRLYGLDPDRQSIVIMTASTLTPTLEIGVGSIPTDLTVSLDGSYLFVGHLGTLALARIDLDTPTFDGFVPVPRVPFDIEALAGGRVAVIDDDQWTTVTLLDGATGAVLDERYGLYEGALTSANGGTSLYVGESSLSGSNIMHFTFAGDTLALVDQSDYDSGYGFPYPPRLTVAAPDGSGVYYASYFLDGADLSILLYPLANLVYTVTPDSRLAIGATQVFDVTSGAALGSLPTPGTVQAVSPDSSTLYVVSGAGIATVDLTGF